MLFIGLTLLIIGCNTEASFTFEKQHLDTKAILDCNTDNCVSFDINLLKINDDRPVCKIINKEIERVACTLLNTEENTIVTTLPEAIKKFDLSYRKINKEFPGEIPNYEANITSELSFQCKAMVSILMDSYMFTRGAHGYGGVYFINLNTKTGKRIYNKDLFKEYSRFKAYAEKTFRSKYEILENESINSPGFLFENDKFALPNNIGITDTEVILYYNSYEISSYADGPVELKMRKEDVAAYFAFDIF